jgi:DHA2 family methylenomycin A resistance protein-like MFS transporter
MPESLRDDVARATGTIGAAAAVVDGRADCGAGTAAAEDAAVLGFFVVTLDAVVVNVSLPSIRGELGGGITGLQWVVDGYTLMFAALLLSAGSLSDRFGVRRAFGVGVTVFVLASLACGLAPSMGALVAARFVQGAAAAMMMPSSMALIGQAYPDPVKRARAVAMWALGGSVASSAGPVRGGVLTLVSWRLIYFLNLPAGALRLGRAGRRGRGDERADLRGDRGWRRRIRSPAGAGRSGGCRDRTGGIPFVPACRAIIRWVG